MHYTCYPGFDSRWRPNIFNSVLFKKACEKERIHLIMSVVVVVVVCVYVCVLVGVPSYPPAPLANVSPLNDQGLDLLSQHLVCFPDGRLRALKHDYIALILFEVILIESLPLRLIFFHFSSL